MSPDRILQPYVRDGEILTAVHIDFVKGSEDPGRVFRAASRLIDALTGLDRDLLAVVSLGIQPVELLEEIEEGSLRTWLITRLRQIDDEALRSGDWKRILGEFLVQAKAAALRWLEDKPKIERLEDLVSLEDEIMELARRTEVLPIETYAPVPRRQMLERLQSIGEAGSQLGKGDSASYLIPGGSIALNTDFRLSAARVDELLTSEIIPARQELTLLVKRPDYLSSAQWEFRYQEHTIRAKILDDEWLDRFHKRLEDVRPGDSLRARVNAELLRDSRGAQVAVRYFVAKVLQVIRGQPDEGQLLLPPFGEGLDDAG